MEENTNVMSNGIRKGTEPLPCIVFISCPNGHEHPALGTELVDKDHITTTTAAGKTEQVIKLGIQLENQQDGVCPTCGSRRGMVKWWTTFPTAEARTEFLKTKASDCVIPMGEPLPA